MKSVAVFCGSSFGNNDVFAQHAALLGKTLAKQGRTLVYGGAKVGLMGVLANAALDAGGTVIGVLPRFLSTKEIAHTGLTELILVNSMHERKAKMNELCDGVIAIPGGYGTMEEFFELLTWAQLGLHKKPVAILNIGGFYNGLLALADNMVGQGFLKQQDRNMLLADDNIEMLLQKMKLYVAPEVNKWINKETT
ncbi:MAG TPA: TIGR00730 family Rossman fold protein [Chitinophagaceae bacterium]|nr:TIGR00730 family Rossman fold protein [Chitinophagaceae bacterium]